MENRNEPVHLTGKVKINNEGEGKKFLKLFFAGSFIDALKYAFDNVFVPYTKDAICRTSTNVISFWVNGDKPAMNQNVGPNRVSYWGGVGGTRQAYQQPTTTPARVQNNIYSVGTLYFDNRGDAETVLLKMRENLLTYKVATVADLYDIAGMKFSFTDYKYGWRNLDSACVVRSNDGNYYIDLPKSMPIEN